jgi:type IV pilus assembly protein PilE
MKPRGFTLIELMVVLAIVGILAAIAYPSFHRYIVRSKRAQAQGLLLQLMQQQERYYSRNNSYIVFSAGASDPQQKLFRWWSGNSAADSAYELAGLPCADTTIAQCVQLTATPGTANVDSRFRDDDCGVLALTSTGERSASGERAADGKTAAGARCWP